MKPYVCHLNEKSSKLSTIRELRNNTILAIRTDMKKRKEYKNESDYHAPINPLYRFRYGIPAIVLEQETYRYLDMCYQDFLGNSMCLP